MDAYPYGDGRHWTATRVNKRFSRGYASNTSVLRRSEQARAQVGRY